MKISEMYKLCKPYQNHGFETYNLSKIESVNAMMCGSYFRALINTGVKNCHILSNKEIQKGIDKTILMGLGVMTANSNANLEAVITSFMNFAEKTSEKWEDFVDWSYHEFIGKKFPCVIN